MIHALAFPRAEYDLPRQGLGVPLAMKAFGHANQLLHHSLLERRALKPAHAVQRRLGAFLAITVRQRVDENAQSGLVFCLYALAIAFDGFQVFQQR
nr:hypothetical protein [Chromobacterium alkanivorans]